MDQVTLDMSTSRPLPSSDDSVKLDMSTSKPLPQSKEDRSVTLDLSTSRPLPRLDRETQAAVDRNRIHPEASMSAAPSTWASFKGAVEHPINYLSDVEADVTEGGGRTFVGRGLGHMQHGSMEDTGYTADKTPVASIMAGPIQGPPKVLRGALRMAEDVKDKTIHPIRSEEEAQAGKPDEFVSGLNEAVSGAIQTPGPLIMMNPTALPRAAAAVGVSDLTKKALGYIGVPDEYSELASNITGGAAASAPELAPHIADLPPVKYATEMIKPELKSEGTPSQEPVPLIREKTPGTKLEEEYREREAASGPAKTNPLGRIGGTKPAAEPVTPAQLTKEIKSEPGYVYHATNAERLQEIADAGKLDVHKPSFGTDQEAWPDGSTEKRAYFTSKANIAWQFAPEEGTPVAIRVKDAGLKVESTGDHYSKSPIKSDQLEFLANDGNWHPVDSLRDQAEPAAPSLDRLTAAIEKGAGGRPIIKGVPLKEQLTAAIPTEEPEHLGQFARTNGTELDAAITKEFKDATEAQSVRDQLHSIKNADLSAAAVKAGVVEEGTPISRSKTSGGITRAEAFQKLLEKSGNSVTNVLRELAVREHGEAGKPGSVGEPWTVAGKARDILKQRGMEPSEVARLSDKEAIDAAKEQFIKITTSPDTKMSGVRGVIRPAADMPRELYDQSVARAKRVEEIHAGGLNDKQIAQQNSIVERYNSATDKLQAVAKRMDEMYANRESAEVSEEELKALEEHKQLTKERAQALKEYRQFKKDTGTESDETVARRAGAERARSRFGQEVKLQQGDTAALAKEYNRLNEAYSKVRVKEIRAGDESGASPEARQAAKDIDDFVKRTKYDPYNMHEDLLNPKPKERVRHTPAELMSTKSIVGLKNLLKVAEDNPKLAKHTETYQKWLDQREADADAKAELRKVNEKSRQAAEKGRTHPFVDTDKTSRMSFSDYDKAQEDMLDQINAELRKSDIPAMQRWEMPTKAKGQTAQDYVDQQVGAQKLKQASSKLGKPPKSEPVKTLSSSEKKRLALQKLQAAMRRRNQ